MTAQEDNRARAEAGAEEIGRILSQLRRRGEALAAVSGSAWILAGGVVLFDSLVVALGWWGGNVCRVLGWIGFLGGLAVLAGAGLVAPLRDLARKDAIARRLGAVWRELASDVLTASQLASRGSRRDFSPALVARHFDGVLLAIADTPASRVFPARVLVWPATGLVLAFAVASVSYAALPGVMEAGLLALVRDPLPPEPALLRARSLSPVVADLSLTLRYPEYLGRPERRIDMTSGGFLAPLGTTVLLDGRSLVEGADRGTVTTPGEHRAPLVVDGNGAVHGSFVVSAEGAFFLSLGTASYMIRGPDRMLEVEKDRPPVMRLKSPEGSVEIDEDGEVELAFEAEDDHGLDRVDLVLHADPGLEIRKTIVRVADGVSRLRSTYRWSPQSVRLSSLAEVRLELEAFDDDTILGPKPGRSEPLTVRVMTPLARHQGAIDEQGRVLDALVDLLGKRIEAPPESEKRLEEAKERFSVLRSETEDVLGRVGRLLHGFALDPLMPRRVQDTFTAVRNDLSNQIIHETRLHRDPVAPLDKRLAVDRVTVKLLEEAVIRVDDLMIEQQLARLVSGGGELETARAGLGALLATFERTRSEPARRAVLDAVSKIEDGLARLGREIDSIRGRVGDTYVNPGTVASLDLASSLARLRALLAAGDVSAAIDLVAALERDLGKLMSALEGGLLSFRTDRFSEGERFSGQLLDRLSEIEGDQLQVRRQSTALSRDYEERLVELMRDRIGPLVKQELGRLASLRASLESAAAVGGAQGKGRLARLRTAARELEIALGQKEIEEARELALDMRDMVDAWALAEGSSPTAAVEQAGRTAAQIAADLAAAYPRPAQIFSERDRAGARNDAAAERHLTADTRKLHAWALEQKEEVRFLAQMAATSLKLIEARMSEAVTHLENLRVREAVAEQSAALEELARLREDLRRGSEAAPLEAQPVIVKTRVEIPAPEEYEVPPEFRADILEAMRGDAPSRYKEAIQRYYEALVR
ncbi:MAG: hypothetical protein PHU25_05205 [Deltaproteobacteria bacterium]|nr:hypothetical protein [Deltaproteobacteria bacterium]